jgi:aminopeptidase YwaD
VGSEGNRLATRFFGGVVSSFGFSTESVPFDCIDWTREGAELSAGGARFDVSPSPYSLGCRASAPLVVVSSIQELEAAHISGRIVLMRGELAREQIMPKGFPFYNPDHHRHIVHVLESAKPEAIVCATSRDVEMVGAQYPFPLFEDGDFDIPSVYMTEEEGLRLAARAGQETTVESRAWRIPATGDNVTARKAGSGSKRIVLFAHIDARLDTQGANDNASGVVVLLLLAELLAGYSGRLGIELVAMNGEDYYAAPGEKQYLAANEGRFDEVLLGINLDDVAYYRGKIAYSLYGCEGDLAGAIRTTLARHEDLIEGPAWYQGDHGLFLMNQVPALAVTSELLDELMSTITHTPRDTVDIVDPSKAVSLARALHELLLHLSGQEVPA